MDFIDNCFTDVKANFLVGEAGFISSSYYSDETIRSSYLIGDAESVVPRIFTAMPTHSIIVMASSPVKLNAILQNSSRWDSHQMIFILDSERSETRCTNAGSLLLEAWKNDRLNAIFICFNEHKIVSLYTFNPYTDEAPKPWKKLSIIPAIYNHPWTLFKRHYHSSK